MSRYTPAQPLEEFEVPIDWDAEWRVYRISLARGRGILEDFRGDDLPLAANVLATLEADGAHFEANGEVVFGPPQPGRRGVVECDRAWYREEARKLWPLIRELLLFRRTERLDLQAAADAR